MSATAPGNEVFDLAQAAFARGAWQEARDAYQRFLAQGGAGEQGWVATYRAGLCALQLDLWEAAVATLLAAWERNPGRSEPLATLASAARRRSDNHLALLLARQALANAPPEPAALAFDRSAYFSSPLEDVSISAFYTGERELGRQACEALLHERSCATVTRDLAARNSTYYLETVAPTFHRHIPLADDIRSAGEIATAGSLVADDDGYRLLVRLQTRDPDHQTYAGRVLDWTQRARNAVVLLDSTLVPQQVAVLDDRAHDRLAREPLGALAVHGIEQAHLTRWDGAWWLTGLSCHAVPAGERGVVLARLDTAGTRIERALPLVRAEGAAPAWEQSWLPVVGDAQHRLLAAFDPPQVLAADVASGRCSVAQVAAPAAYLGRYRPVAGLAPDDDGYLALAEDVAVVDERRVALYRFVRLSAQLEVVGVSRPFGLHRPGHDRIGGLCRSHDGTHIVLAWSNGPNALWVSELPREVVAAALFPLEQLTPQVEALAPWYTRRRGVNA
ncbi:MAG: hypothetical protein DCC58_13250 [Chloroflexi bacterium]|nr:MAG: hypothetical protein DCC58_13250 [Chloroflexota bacterium]